MLAFLPGGSNNCSKTTDVQRCTGILSGWKNCCWLLTPLVTASLPPGYSIKLPVSPSFLSNLLQQDYKQCTWWRKTTRGRVVNNRQILAGFGWKQNVGIRGSHTFPTPPLSGETHMPLRDGFLTFWAKVLKHVGNCLQVSFCFNAKTFIKILL